MNLPVMVPDLDRDTLLEWCRRIDRGPYASLAAGERIAFPNPEILVTLSAAAAVTERVRIVLTVLVLPMHDAVWAAKQIATLDVISGGRVTLGLGVGAREEDFRAVSAPWDGKRLRRLEAQIETLRRAWAGEEPADGVAPVGPRPVQEGGPPLLAGALLPQSIARAARWAEGICGFSFGPMIEEISFQMETARTAWSEAGRAAPPRYVAGCWFALGADPTAQLAGYLDRYLSFMGPGAAEGVVPGVRASSPAGARDVLRMLSDQGVDEVLWVPTSADPDEVDRMADAVASAGLEVS